MFSSSALLLVAALIGLNVQVNAFLLINTSRQPFTGRTYSMKRNIPKNSDLKMAFDTDFPLILSSPLLASASLIHPLSAISGGALQNPLVEAELFSDAAHIAMDLSSLFGTNNLILQILVIIGRLFGIASDYIPDQSINPEEFAFQTVMLGLSCKDLFANLCTKWQASCEEHDMRDMRCYCTLFDKADVSWSQYKLMLTTASQWIDVEPSSILSEAESHSDCMYWLYSGKVSVEGKDTQETLQHIARKSEHLLGSLPNTVLKVGTSGATLLRIDTSKLQTTLNVDDGLASALQSLRFQSMQASVVSLIEHRR